MAAASDCSISLHKGDRERKSGGSNRISIWQTYGLYSSLCLATIYLSFSVWDTGCSCSCSCSSSGHLRYAGPLGSDSPAPRRLPPKQQHSVRISPITARTAGNTGTDQHQQQQREQQEQQREQQAEQEERTSINRAALTALDNWLWFRLACPKLCCVVAHTHTLAHTDRVCVYLCKFWEALALGMEMHSAVKLFVCLILSLLTHTHTHMDTYKHTHTQQAQWERRGSKLFMRCLSVRVCVQRETQREKLPSACRSFYTLAAFGFYLFRFIPDKL